MVYIPADVRKALTSLDDGMLGAVVLVDYNTGLLKFFGDEAVRNVCFETGTYVLQRLREQEITAQNKKANSLPYLPPGGINGMCMASIERYWNKTMHQVLPHRKRHLGYETPR